MDSGEQFVTISGIQMRLLSCASSLVTMVGSYAFFWTELTGPILCVGPSIPFTGAYFGQGTGLILLGGLTCSGTEASLFECSIYYSIDSVRCFHYWDAGVSCSDGMSHVSKHCMQMATFISHFVSYKTCLVLNTCYGC